MIEFRIKKKKMKKPKNYYCHRILTDAADRDGVPKKFEIVEKIG